MNVARVCVFDDVTETIEERVHTNNDDWGELRCDGGSVSVRLQR